MRTANAEQFAVPSFLLVVSLLLVLTGFLRNALFLLLPLALWLYPILIAFRAKAQQDTTLLYHSLCYVFLLTTLIVGGLIVITRDSGDQNMKAQGCVVRCMNELDHPLPNGASGAGGGT